MCDTGQWQLKAKNQMISLFVLQDLSQKLEKAKRDLQDERRTHENDIETTKMRHMEQLAGLESKLASKEEEASRMAEEAHAKVQALTTKCAQLTGKLEAAEADKESAQRWVPSSLRRHHAHSLKRAEREGEKLDACIACWRRRRC